jgi:hypothetical protein
LSTSPKVAKPPSVAPLVVGLSAARLRAKEKRGSARWVVARVCQSGTTWAVESER